LIPAYIEQLRPRQWTKNLILFAGIIFAEQALNPELLLRAFLGFITFCLVSSAVYCFNDLADLENDRRHPDKRMRPLPSGRLSRGSVWALGVVLLGMGLLLGFWLDRGFGTVAAVYFLLNLAYSLWLKRVVILDLILLATGFVLRAVASVEVLGRDDVVLSPWLVLCTFFLALFIGAGKRRSEIALLAEDAASHRAALGDYSLPFLDRIITTTLTAAILSYAIYTLAPGTQSKFHTHYLVYTVPFVVFGLLRYTYLIYERRVGGNPTDAILSDRQLVLDVILWVVTVMYILYRW